jgi:hypothetical protein
MRKSKLILYWVISYLITSVRSNEFDKKGVLSSAYNVINNKKAYLAHKQNFDGTKKLFSEKRNKRYAPYIQDYEESYPSYYDNENELQKE